MLAAIDSSGVTICFLAARLLCVSADQSRRALEKLPPSLQASGKGPRISKGHISSRL
jgi:hypothetical protein